jgi:hypothetical protein
LTFSLLTGDMHAAWGVLSQTTGPVRLYIVGTAQYVWRLDGTSWLDPLPVSGPTFFDAWRGSSTTDLFVVGANATVLAGPPNTMTQQVHTCTAGHLRTVIGGGSKTWFAGEGGKVCYCKSAIQELAHNKTTETLNAAWYDSSSGNIWFAGNTGTVLRVDSGGVSSLIATPVKGNLRGIWGSSGSDIWAVGGNGLILHYDGATWSQVSSPTSKVLHDVWGSSAGNVWAVGMGGTVIRFYGGGG